MLTNICMFVYPLVMEKPPCHWQVCAYIQIIFVCLYKYTYSHICIFAYVNIYVICIYTYIFIILYISLSLTMQFLSFVAFCEDLQHIPLQQNMYFFILDIFSRVFLLEVRVRDAEGAGAHHSAAAPQRAVDDLRDDGQCRMG